MPNAELLRERKTRRSSNIQYQLLRDERAPIRPNSNSNGSFACRFILRLQLHLSTLNLVRYRLQSTTQCPVARYALLSKSA